MRYAISYATLAILIYAAGTWSAFAQLRGKRRQSTLQQSTLQQSTTAQTTKQTRAQHLFLFLGMLAALPHGLYSYHVLLTQTGINLGLFPLSTLIGWIIVVIMLASSRWRPIESSAVAIYPLAMLTLIASIAMDQQTDLRSHVSPLLGIHITLSITAYSVIVIACIQSLLMLLQNHYLKHKQAAQLLVTLPALESMEAFLFELITGGFALLTAAIISGFLFYENVFTQALSQKTLFSLMAWCIFGTLLIGRHAAGWRGQTIVKWTCAGCALLIVGFWGSQFILEVMQL